MGLLALTPCPPEPSRRAKVPAAVGLRARIGRWLWPLTVGLTLLQNARIASANGRYPSAQQLLVGPTDANHLWLRTTYGLVTSADGGASWDWICESGVGYGGQQDAMVAATVNGKVFVAAEDGLFVTTDNGCGWSRNPDIGANYVRDIAVESDGRHVLALVLVVGDTTYDLVVFRSDAEGEHFTAVGPALSDNSVGETIDPAPSDPRRIYVTSAPLYSVAADGGAVPDGAVLFRSSDGGETWQVLPIPGASRTNPAFIAAIHPTNPDVVYIRVQSTRSGGQAESLLLYTDDAGDSFKEIFRGPADLLGFSLSADGNEVLIGLGDPFDPTGVRTVDAAALGIYRAAQPDFSFTRRFSGHVGCLTRSSGGLFICGNTSRTEFILGLSTDAGQTALPVLELGHVRGPLACGQTLRICQPEWPQSCALVDSCSSGARDAGVSPTDTPTHPTTTQSGCGCVVSHGPARHATDLWAVLAVLGALSFRASRRRRAAIRLRNC